MGIRKQQPCGRETIFVLQHPLVLGPVTRKPGAVAADKWFGSSSLWFKVLSCLLPLHEDQGRRKPLKDLAIPLLQGISSIPRDLLVRGTSQLGNGVSAEATVAWRLQKWGGEGGLGSQWTLTFQANLESKKQLCAASVLIKKGRGASRGTAKAASKPSRAISAFLSFCTQSSGQFFMQCCWGLNACTFSCSPCIAFQTAD